MANTFPILFWYPIAFPFKKVIFFTPYSTPTAWAASDPTVSPSFIPSLLFSLLHKIFSENPFIFRLDNLLHSFPNRVILLLAVLYNQIRPDEPLRIPLWETEGGGTSGESHSIECRRCKVRPDRISQVKGQSRPSFQTVSVCYSSELLIFRQLIFYFIFWRISSWIRC